ncbi:MAG: CRISPR system precrRNA processing endoribonuclease RAMP protein Cas6, partial [Gammaproteobacteria bacterium]
SFQSSLTPLIPIVRYRFRLEAFDDLHFPAYPGSTWRGLLGHGLRRAVCVTHQPRCDGCLLAGTCIYSTLFESPAPSEAARRRFTSIPHPFILALDRPGPRRVLSRQFVSVGVNLVGEANNAVPYLIHALNLAGQRGIGTAQGRFRVASVHQEPKLGEDVWEQVYDIGSATYRRLPTALFQLSPPPDRIALILMTPLRIKRDGRFVVPRTFRPGDLLYHLGLRLAMLQAFYGGDGSPDIPRRIELEEPEGLLLEHNLHWHEWTRYSSRQQTEMQMGGLIGDMVLDGAVARPYWSRLWMGQWCHLGKGTSMGLGRYRLTDVASLPPARRTA